jgi:hypothetical protein
MIVWGGLRVPGEPDLGDGARYDPARDAWTPTSAVGAPSARAEYDAFWTGTQMIIWGGTHRTGGLYDPGTDTWTAMPASTAPFERFADAAVWTGTEMIVWGGCCDTAGADYVSGGHYDPATNMWGPMSQVGTPSGRSEAVAVWTGTEMIVWGGAAFGGSFLPLADGGRYDPAADSWAAISATGAPDARCGASAVWTGTEMIVWGGLGTADIFNSGGRYDPLADVWAPTSVVGAPGARVWHAAVWTGALMIVAGGAGGGEPWLDGGRYDPAADSWTPTAALGAPPERAFPTAVWTGAEMIVWGGLDYDVVTAMDVYPIEGGRYAP